MEDWNEVALSSQGPLQQPEKWKIRPSPQKVTYFTSAEMARNARFLAFPGVGDGGFSQLPLLPDSA